jgi:oligopeptide transport system substrate-binding protein
MFQAGDLDLALDPPWEALGVPGVAPRIHDAPRLTYLKPNHARPLLSDARVRRALSLAIDRDFITEALYRAYAAPAYTVIPALPDMTSRMMAQRREEARALIQEAGAEGARFELLQSGDEREGLAIALADDWRQIGIETVISRTDATGLYAAVDEGRFDLALARFDRGMKTDAWRYLEPFAPGGFAANFGWDSPELAAALEAIRAEADPARRDTLAREAEAAIMDAQQAVIPLQHEKAAWLQAPGLRDKADGQPLFWADLNLS